ncbi:MAG: hypothetical protein JWR18_127 [Segetibacter sp.]|nr:hypothetical protein [Segetibacter sp.]
MVAGKKGIEKSGEFTVSELCSLLREVVVFVTFERADTRDRLKKELLF